MEENYQQIDSVFGQDVSMCGVNLKKLWCEYACYPQKTNFVHGHNYFNKTMDGGYVQEFTNVTFDVDEDMACTLF